MDSRYALRNSSSRWGLLAQLLHWLVVVLVAVQLSLAWIAERAPLAKKIGPLALHKSWGITILGLMAARLLWRWANPVPAPPAGSRPAERLLAGLSHAGLYLLLFAMPLSGWLMSSARGFPVSWFGLVQLPDLVPRNVPLYDAMRGTHEALAWLLAVLLVLHVAAALRHHFVLRDDVFRRMLPFTDPR